MPQLINREYRGDRPSMLTLNYLVMRVMVCLFDFAQ